MNFDSHKNLPVTTVTTAPSPATTGTTFSVPSGEGARLPAVPFDGTFWPAGQLPMLSNAEIVRVTAQSGDSITAMTRHQGGTTAQSITAGFQFAASTTAHVLQMIEDAAAQATLHPPAMGNSLTKLGVVIPLGTTGDPDVQITESPATLACPENGKLACVYTGYDSSTVARICLAWSDDARTWTKAGSLLAGTGVSGDPDRYGCTAPFLLYENGLYYLFYGGLGSTGYEGPPVKLCLATSPSLTSPTWTRRGAVLSPSGAVGWRNGNVFHPSIVKSDGKWYCFINANGTNENIGVATADALLGPWTFDDANAPLFSLLSGKTAQGDPSVWKIPGGWRMDFYAYNGTNAWDFYATTTDAAFPYGWVVGNSSNPILLPDTSYDGKFAHKPFIRVHSGRVFHYYTAVSASNVRQIALAVDPPITDLSIAPQVSGTTDSLRLASLLTSLAALGLVVSSAPTVSDTFTRANGAMGNAETGQAWVSGGGSGFAIASNQCAWTGASDGVIVVNSGLSDNYDIQFKLSAITGTFPLGVIARASSATSWIKIYRDEGSTHHYWRLVNDTGTTALTGTTGTTTPVSGDTLKIRVQGTTYTVFLNGTQVQQFTGVTAHNSTSDTFQGVAGSGALALTVDDFYITPV